MNNSRVGAVVVTGGLLVAALVLAAAPPILLSAWAEDFSTSIAGAAWLVAITGGAGLVAGRISLRHLADRSSSYSPAVPHWLASGVFGLWICVSVVAVLGSLVSWSRLTPLWASGVTLFCVTAIVAMRWVVRSVQRAQDVDDGRLEAIAYAGSRAAADGAALLLSRSIDEHGLSWLPPCDAGGSVLRHGEVAHLTIPMHYWRLINGQWVEGAPCVFVATTERLIARTSEHGELSFWWHGVVAHQDSPDTAELHFTEGAPLRLAGENIAIMKVYVRNRLAVAA